MREAATEGRCALLCGDRVGVEKADRGTSPRWSRENGPMAGCGGCEKEKHEERWPDSWASAEEAPFTETGRPGKERPDRENRVQLSSPWGTCQHPPGRVDQPSEQREVRAKVRLKSN